MTSTPLAHLPLRPSTHSLLQQRGFLTCEEIEESKASGGLTNLAQELSLPLAETAALVREVQTAARAASKPETATALSLLRSQKTRSIITFCKAVDIMLGGGFSIGEVTEICGLPGAGKTQLAMQLCVNTALPLHIGGVDGSAVYIDTEGSFCPERCQTMSMALVHHVQKSANKGAIPEWFTSDNILDNIHVFRVYDEATQMATLQALPQFLESQTERPVRLVVVDSIAFHFRSETSDFMARSRAISTAASLLSDMATKYNLATVVVNQMTTKVLGPDTSMIVPALGEAWAHAVTTRLIIEQEQLSVRRCRLVKSPHKACSEALLEVRECGIRDVPRSLLSGKENEAPKRQRID